MLAQWVAGLGIFAVTTFLILGVFLYLSDL